MTELSRLISEISESSNTLGVLWVMDHEEKLIQILFSIYLGGIRLWDRTWTIWGPCAGCFKWILGLPIEHHYAYSIGPSRASMLSMMVSLFQGMIWTKVPTHVHCGLKELKNLLDETDSATRVPSSPKRLLNFRVACLPPKAALALWAMECAWAALSEAFSVLSGSSHHLKHIRDMYAMCLWLSREDDSMFRGKAFWA